MKITFLITYMVFIADMVLTKYIDGALCVCDFHGSCAVHVNLFRSTVNWMFRYVSFAPGYCGRCWLLKL